MGRSLTNNLSFAYAIEDTPKVLPVSPAWKLVEPNSINGFGSTLTTITRSPISKNRQRRKGSVTDLDSRAEFAADVTMEHINAFAEGFVFSTFKGPLAVRPTAVISGGSGGLTVTSGGSLPAGTLVYIRGSSIPSNNGLKVVASGSSNTNIRINGLQAEASTPGNMIAEVAGVQGAAGDLHIDVDGNLTSTVLDFTTLALTPGQFLYLGGDSASTRFFEDDNRGYARIRIIAAHKITLDKRASVYGIDDGTDTGAGGTGRTIQVFFGKYVRNVPVDNADYLERTFQFELAYADLGDNGADKYEYSKGNFSNTLAVELPLNNKPTMTFGFIGLDTEPPTLVRATNAASATQPLKVGAFNTTSDVSRLRIIEVDETGLTTDFKSLTMNINNNVTPEKVIGTLGARYVNAGNFEIDIRAQLLFTDSAVAEAVRENRTVTMDFGLRNDDGAIMVDIPSMTLNAGDREFPVNQSILINTTAQAFQDTFFNTSLGISTFPYTPAA